MRYAAVIFDMGDIFFDATVWRRTLVQHLQQQGVEIDYREFCRRWEQKLVAVYVGRREYWDTFHEFVTESPLVGRAVDETIAFAREKAAEIEQRTLFEGVAETLAALKRQGLKLAVLSDTESREERVRRRLADLDIERFFDAVVTSRDIGHVKPQPQAFAAVLERLDTAPKETMFVGHDEDELDGAKRVGLTAVAYNHEAGVPCDHSIRGFGELLELVD